MSQSTLLSIAPELILSISDELDVFNVGVLRRTCKQLAVLLQPRIYQTLCINFDVHKLDENLHKLRVLAAGHRVAARSTKRLVITSLAPSFDKLYRGPVSRYVNGAWVEDPPPEHGPEVAEAEEELRRLFYPAISSLKNVETVRWSTNELENPDLRLQLLDVISNLNSMHTLHLHIHPNCADLPIESIKGLKELYVARLGSYNNNNAQLFSNVGHIVANSPNLHTLGLSEGRYNSQESFSQVFEHMPKNSDGPILPLRQLEIDNFFVTLDDTTLSHLRNLTTLRLRNVVEVYSASSRGLSDEEIEVISPMQTIWKQLIDLGVQLEDLEVDHAPPAFMQYLASYSGLKRLYVRPGGFRQSGSSNRAARTFWNQAFPNHISTLKSLSILPRYEGSWCFNAETASLILKCSQLKELTVSIQGPSRIKSHMQMQDGTSEGFNIVTTLIDGVTQHMPHLKSLTICPTYREGHRHARCGTGPAMYYSALRRDISDAVEQYTPPLNCHKLPDDLYVCTDRFVPSVSDEARGSGLLSAIRDRGAAGPSQVPSENGRLRYVCITNKDDFLW